MIITREDAIETLQTVIDAIDVLGNEELSDKLTEIVGCIEEEMSGRHTWGGDEEEVVLLHTAFRDDLWTKELTSKIDKIDKKYKFVPCDAEKDHLIELMKEELEMTLDIEDSDIVDLDKIVKKYFGIK